MFMTLTTRLAVSPPPHSHESLVMAASKGRASCNGNPGNTRIAWLCHNSYMNEIQIGEKNGQIIGILPVLPGFSYGVFGDDLLG